MRRFLFATIGLCPFIFSLAYYGYANICINVGGSPPPPPPPSNPIDPSFMPSLTYSGPSWVWNTDLSTKVFQDTGGPGDVSTLHVSTPSGFPGESVYFQLHIQAQDSSLTAINVDMSNLVSTFDGTVMSTQTASSPGICRWYREYYVDVTTRSVNLTIGGGYYDAYNHFVPDAVVPRIEPYYSQRTNAFPVSITAGNNQSFLLECDIPAGQKAGIYAYTVKVMNGNSLVASVPGALEVAAGAVPVIPTQKFYSGVDSTSMCQQITGGTGCPQAQLDLWQHDVAVYCLDHRMSCANLDVTASFASAQTTFGHLFTGTVSGTYINTIFPGTSLQVVRSGLIDSSNSNQATWVNGFISNSYSTTTVKPFDQAQDESWTGVNALIASVAASKVPTLVTGNYNGMTINGSSGTLNSLGTLVNDLGNNPTYAALTVAWVNTASGSTRSAGQYNDCESGGCSGNGAFPLCSGGQYNGSGVYVGAGGTNGTYFNHHIDGTPMGNYGQPLAIWHDTFTYQFNSTLTMCWNASQTCGALSTHDPWLLGGMLFANFSHNSTTSDGQGDETWGYPGTPSHIGVSTPTFVGSLRLLLNTVGEEDVERANILSNAGLKAYAQAQLAAWYKSQCNWNLNPYLVTTGFTGTMQQMRQNYLCKINQQTYGGSTVCAW